MVFKQKMSAKKCKNLIAMEEDPNDSDSESSSDNGDDNPHPDAYSGNEEVIVDFGGRPPIDPDCYGICQLLERVFLKAHINCMQVADLIIAQNFVGSVVYQYEPEGSESDTDEDICEDWTIFGITTVLNITVKKNIPCIDQFLSFVIQKAEKHATDAALKHFRKVLGNEGTHVGYLINERFINIPAQISVPLLENLYKEITIARNKGMPYDFAYFLVIIKFYRMEAKKEKPKEDTYTNAEEELLVEKAVSSFEYSVADECDMGMSGNWLEGDATLTPCRKILLFDAKIFPQLIFDIKKYISGH